MNPKHGVCPLYRGSSRSGTGRCSVQQNWSGMHEKRLEQRSSLFWQYRNHLCARAQATRHATPSPLPSTLSCNRTERTAKARKLFERKRLAATRGINIRCREQRSQLARNALPFWSAPGKVRLA